MKTNQSQAVMSAAILALFVTAAVPVRADGLIAGLPEDGSFSRFRMTNRLEATKGRRANIPQGVPAMEADAPYFIWRHEKAPFGVAAVRQEIEMKRDEAVMARHRIELQLVAGGTDAESDLPNHN